MASWLVRSTPDRVVQVRVLARDIVLCSWARHFTLTVPLEFNAVGNPAMDWHPIQGGSRNTSSRFMLQKPEISASLMGLLGS